MALLEPIVEPTLRPAQAQRQPPADTVRVLPDPPATRAPTPLVDALRGHLRRGTVSLGRPGHKGGAGADAKLRELLGDGPFRSDVALDAATYEAARRQAERRIASLWGADRAFVLANGSSSANQALLLGALAAEDSVVCARDVQPATHAALVFAGARPVWVQPEQDPKWVLGTGVSARALAAALQAHPQARMAFVVSPSYAGVCSDLPRLAAVAHQRGVPLVVDETWGPHLRFGAAAGLPVDALTAGADAVITSTHTMLSSLSQTSVLLVRGGRLPLDRIAAAVRMTETTRPYLPLVASVDACRAQMEEDGAALVGWAVDLARLARSLLARIPGLRVLEAADLGLGGAATYAGLDPCTIVVDVRGRGVDGRCAERALREVHGIAPEGADASHVYLVIGPGDSVATVRRLALALSAVGGARAGSIVPLDLDGMPAVAAVPAMTPRAAHFAAHQRVPLDQAAGRISAELIAPNPPGTPVLVPGERITPEIACWLRRAAATGVHLDGPDDPSLQTVRVVVASGLPTSELAPPGDEGLDGNHPD